MEKFSIELDIPYDRNLRYYIIHDNILASDLQEAVDIAFSREIAKDKEHLLNTVIARVESVIKREEIFINENGDYLHPSRLSDYEIKNLLILDAKYNNQPIDIDSLEKRIFLI